jgi:hypothetical protein
MKLGEALALRADLQKRLHQAQARLFENASVQEGDAPALDPQALLREFRAIASEHESVVRRINRTNVRVSVVVDDASLTLADAVLRRDLLAREAGLLRELATRAAPQRSRFLHTEVKHVPAIDIAAVLADADRLSRAHRELDTRIQQVNWTAELIEA